MKFVPHQYQRKAMAWVADKDRCCLFMGMGLGKSTVVLTAFARLRSACECCRLLVVAPKRVAESTWSDEAAKWDHLAGFEVALCLGDAKRRLAAIDSGADVMVVGRDTMPWLVETMAKRKEWPWDMIAIDELTSFKSAKAKRTKAMAKASKQATRVVGLTGTPAPNGLQDLWAQMFVVDLGKTLGTSERVFHASYFNDVVWNNVVIKRSIKAGAEAKIRGLLASACLAMDAADYLDVPPMVETDMWVDMGAGAKRYKQMERDQVTAFMESEREGVEVTALSAGALCNKLSQMANGFVYDAEHGHHDLHDAKMEALAELWQGASAEGSGLLTFYQYERDKERALDALRKAGANVRTYEGADDLKAWNAKECDALLCHPASTAFGLNMQAGGWCVAWIGTGWNLELYQQANARLHRQGQTHPVAVTRILAKGSIDEKISAAIAAKKGTQAALMNSLAMLREEYGG